MASLNFLDLTKANSNDAVGGIIDELTNIAPELGLFPAEDLGLGVLNYETLHRTARPSVAFASAGEGFDASKSSLRLLLHECFRFGGRVECPKHIADNWRRGGAAGYQAFEAKGVMESALISIGKQIWYGVSTDAKGFPGIKAFTPKGGSYTYDAAGTTATTASSIYMVKFGDEYVKLMAGRARNAAGIMELPDFIIESITDSNSKKMWGYTSELSSYLGLQIAAPHCVVRICNVTADSGKTCTDAKLNAALRLFPANFSPDYIFMSRRSHQQLQDSRTVTLYGQGKTRPDQELQAPYPTSFEGIPIVDTDNILNTDAIE
jgi:Major capsid protein GP7